VSSLQQNSLGSAIEADPRIEGFTVLDFPHPTQRCRTSCLPCCPSFARAHPRVEVEVVVEDRFVDIVGEGFDAGVRLSDPDLGAQASERWPPVWRSAATETCGLRSTRRTLAPSRQRETSRICPGRTSAEPPTGTLPGDPMETSGFHRPEWAVKIAAASLN